jgi:hypothetical protein
MGSPIPVILAAIVGLVVVAGVVAYVAIKSRWLRAEKSTERMRALPETGQSAAIFARGGASAAALSAQDAVERGAPRLRETSVAAWAARIIVLNAEVINIGRSLDNDIVLADDPVSAEHCRLEREGASFRLKDLGSKNKTFVNGRKVEDVVLRNGDEIRVGLATFVFESAGARA